MKLLGFVTLAHLTCADIILEHHAGPREVKIPTEMV